RLALEETLMRGVSRYPDRHRGQGLQGVKNFVASWDGKLSIRSGTARIMIPPKGDWDAEDEEQMQQGLAYFPGAQVQITIPEHVVCAITSTSARCCEKAFASSTRIASRAPQARRCAARSSRSSTGSARER